MTWHPYLPYNAAIVRYNEIATKGRNRNLFEDALGEALKRVLSPVGKLKVLNEHGRLFIRPAEKKTFSAEDIQLMRDILPTVPGLSSLSPGFYIEPTMDALDSVIHTWFPTILEAFESQVPLPPLTYAMRSRRANKAFPLTCEEIERHYAQEILPAHPELHLDLKNASLVIEVEIRYHQAFVSIERIPGAGGLPSGTGGHVLALLSGGFDSPVAVFQMMRRGCTVDYVTFHSDPYTPPEYLSKLVSISRILNSFQPRGRLLAVNLLPAQLEIRDKCQPRHRTVLYRRLMLRIANELAAHIGAKAIVTGDNLGQVASQTLENMAVIEKASELMILRPLLTFEKLESIAIAQRIGTFDLSAQQVPDSCTVFAPDDPAIAAKMDAILEDEAKLDIPALLQACLDSTAVMLPRSDLWTPFFPHETIQAKPSGPNS